MNNDKQFTPEEIIALQKDHTKAWAWSERLAKLLDDEKKQTAAKDEEIRQLKEWKKEQIKTFAPLLDYGQSPESGIQIGRSIVEASIAALKSQKVKDERIMEREAQCLDAERDYRKSFKDGLQKDARIAELEEHIALANVRTKVHINNELEKDARIAELEKENEWLGEHAAMLELAIDNEKAGSGLILTERDQAFALLEEWVKVPLIGRLKYMRQKTASLLSSRENKKPNE